MGYAKIQNLYKDQSILMQREVYALEKIHGTSAHVRWVDGFLHFFSGGATHEVFVAIFNRDALTEKFQMLGKDAEITVYGEAYGGKMQGMSATYGKELRFVAFDVRIGEVWLSVPNAADVAAKLGLEFVDYARGPADLTWINAMRDAESVQAIRNGMGVGHMREGVVLRPIEELFKAHGARIMAKHKRAEFGETKTPREVDPNEIELVRNAQRAAAEWVTEMRMDHVLDKLRAAAGGDPLGEFDQIQQTGVVIRAMLDDVREESEGEIEWSKNVQTAITRAAAIMFKARVTRVKEA